MYLRQLIGIPVGFDPAPFMANLLLYCYERKWLLQAKKTTGPVKGSYTFKCFSFIDDLYTFNNDEFQNNYNDIFPDQLEIKKMEILVKPHSLTF